MRRTVGVIGVVAAVTVGLGVWYGQQHPSRPAPTGRALPTAPVVSGDLVASVQLPGQLGFLGSYTVVGHRTGTATTLPTPGAVLERGAVAYAVDQHPVPLLFGALPWYRRMSVGVTGADVRQLEDNLVALGYGSGVSVDDRFTTATAAAVRRWQRALRVPETGSFAAGDAVAAPGPVRVASVTPLIGQQLESGAVVFTGSGTAAGVRVQVPLANRGYARIGQPVQVRLPDGRTVEGQVMAVGSAAEPPRPGALGGNAGQSGGQGTGTPGGAGQNGCQGANCPQTVAVDIAVPTDPSGVSEGAASVSFIADTRRGVLSVPVEALTLDADGGFVVVVVDAAGRRPVAVTTGLFTAGRVEVSGPGIEAGTPVEVPAL